MTDQHQAGPNLLFFRETPKDFTNRPPLASSLQNLETSFLLVALSRYPHALISCASAIESALKAGFNYRQNERCTFEQLLMQAKQRIPHPTNFDWNKVDDFRKKRNKIIHYGFSPKDDKKSAILLLTAGVPLIEKCYEIFFNFHLKRSGEEFGGLLPNVDWHLNIAQRVYSKAKEIDGVNFTYCFRSFAHDVRWGLNHWMLSDWQKSALGKEEDSGWFSWEFKEQQKKDLESGFETPWSFSCPVCEETDAFIAELDNDALTEGNIRLKKGACANCSLLIPANCPFLADELCMDQILEAKPKILKEYRIEEC